MQSFADTQERLVPMRLQKFLARAGVASRRGSEQLIVDGRVAINGTIVVELGTKVDPITDKVEVDGKPVSLQDIPVTIMLHKPAGYITSMKDPHARHCVSEIIPSDKYPGLFPVGRLDCDTTGLLLCSTDGDLGNRLLHPSHHVEKCYLAKVQGRISNEALHKLEDGVQLEDGLTAPAQARLISTKKERGQEVSHIALIIHEGKKRQVKRMCEAVGHPVLKLHRQAFGPLDLGTLKPGQWRVLTEKELDALYIVAFGKAATGQACQAMPKSKHKKTNR